jgi:hypothetical protein
MSNKATAGMGGAIGALIGGAVGYYGALAIREERAGDAVFSAGILGVFGAFLGAALGSPDAPPVGALPQGTSPTPPPHGLAPGPGLYRYDATSNPAQGSPSVVLTTVDGPPRQYDLMANVAAFQIDGSPYAIRATGTQGGGAGVFSTQKGVTFYFE